MKIQNVTQFLSESTNLIDTIVTQWSDLLIPKSYRQPLIAAWSELKPRWEADIAGFQETSAQTKATLERAGLTDNQLALKLLCLNDAWTHFEERGGMNLLDDLLDWINKILVSVLSAVPGGEALKELKELIEKHLNKQKYDY